MSPSLTEDNCAQPHQVMGMRDQPGACSICMHSYSCSPGDSYHKQGFQDLMCNGKVEGALLKEPWMMTQHRCSHSVWTALPVLMEHR